MRWEFFRFEGSPEELHDLPDWVRRFTNDGESPTNGKIATVGPYRMDDTDEGEEEASQDQELLAYVQARAHSETGRELVVRFAQKVLSWPGLQFKPQKRINMDDLGYFRLWRQGSGLGALAYVWPHQAKVHFRLPEEYAAHKQFAYTLHRDDPYRVAITLVSEEALAEAVELAQSALDLLHR